MSNTQLKANSDIGCLCRGDGNRCPTHCVLLHATSSETTWNNEYVCPSAPPVTDRINAFADACQALLSRRKLSCLWCEKMIRIPLRSCTIDAPSFISRATKLTALAIKSTISMSTLSEASRCACCFLRMAAPASDVAQLPAKSPIFVRKALYEATELHELGFQLILFFLLCVNTKSKIFLGLTPS